MAAQISTTIEGLTARMDIAATLVLGPFVVPGFGAGADDPRFARLTCGKGSGVV
jgi:hypothetical protein